MTIDEAIEKMAKAVWDRDTNCAPWSRVEPCTRDALLSEARAAAEAIGLREMMEWAAIGKWAFDVARIDAADIPSSIEKFGPSFLERKYD